VSLPWWEVRWEFAMKRVQASDVNEAEDFAELLLPQTRYGVGRLVSVTRVDGPMMLTGSDGEQIPASKRL
jgi:hypothetical protein